jgi:hypothetical protein
VRDAFKLASRVTVGVVGMICKLLTMCKGNVCCDVAIVVLS